MAEPTALETFIESRRDELVEFAALLIRTPSPNPPGDERQVAKVLADRLQSYGLATEIAAKAPERPNVLCRVNGGAPGRTLILNGHTDTKPPGDPAQWIADPFGAEIIEGRMYGVGAMDMKGQVAAMTYAAIALAQTSALERGTLALALSTDEEAGSAWGAHYLVEEYGLRGDAVLVGEPSGITQDWEYLAIATRGFSGFRVRVFGTQMHSSLSDLLPSVNASAKMGYVLWRLSNDLKITAPPSALYPQGATLNPGVMVSGGVYYGVYPGEAEFACDIRTLPGMKQETVRQDIDRFIETLRREDPTLRIEWEFQDGPLGWNEGVETSPDFPLVAAALRASERVLGRQPALRGFPGGTDGAVFHHAGIPCVPAFGPSWLSLAHSPNEYIHVEGIVQAAKIYALTAQDYLNRVE